MGRRTRFTTTVDSEILSRFRSFCKDKAMNMSVAFDTMMEQSMNSGVLKEGDMDVGSARLLQILRNPIVARLVWEVVLPEIEAQLGELKGALNMSKKTPE